MDVTLQPRKYSLTSLVSSARCYVSKAYVRHTRDARYR